MNIGEVRDKEDGELEKVLGELRREMFLIRHKAQTEPIDRPSRFNEIRRTIARILTVLKEREMKGVASVENQG